MAFLLTTVLLLSGCFGGGVDPTPVSEEIYGCTDSSALNYNSQATEDDDSCQYSNNPVLDVEGCTNATATNYDQNATVDDNSCIFPPPPIQGCTNSTASNFEANATIDDGSCVFPPPPVAGCTDVNADNFNPQADVDDGSCTYPPPVSGCMDEHATNYNSSATVDDGSCEYPPDDILGCMDVNATNYNSSATVDDGSCTYTPPPIEGCTNSSATNYNSSATVDDGSCEYPPDDILGCMDVNATNYNSSATVDDGSCEYDPGTPPGPSANEELTVNVSNITGEIAHVNGLMKGPTFQTEWNDISCNQQNYQQDIDYRQQFDDLMIPNTRMQGETIGDIDKIWKPWPAYEGYDVTDPANYNFTLTDFGVERTMSTNYTTILLKAGHSKWLEEWERPTCENGPYYEPPENFTIFAQVTKQILMHYREGWADGYNYTKMNMVEVWNEPWVSHWWNGSALEYFELWGEVDQVLNDYFGDDVLVAANFESGGGAYSENLFIYADAVGQTIDAINVHQYKYRPSQNLYDVDGQEESISQLFVKYGYPIDTPFMVTEWNRKIPTYTQSSASQPYIMGTLTMYNDLWHQNGDYGLIMTHFFATGFLFEDDGSLEREGMTFAAYGDMLRNTPVRVGTTGSHYEHDAANHSSGGRTQDVNILAGRSPIGDAVTAAISIYDLTDTHVEGAYQAPDYFSNSSRTVNFTVENLAWGDDCSFTWERWEMKNGGLAINASGVAEGGVFHVSRFESNDRGMHIFRLNMNRSDPDCQLAADDDKDGVDDSIDQCLNTPLLAEIDMVGCALDDDGDGVANILDDCEVTLPGLSVDVNGCVPRTTSSLLSPPLELPSEVPAYFSDWLAAPELHPDYVTKSRDFTLQLHHLKIKRDCLFVKRHPGILEVQPQHWLSHHELAVDS